jgi:hypothetical protein
VTYFKWFREWLVHLEHGAAVLAEDLAELVVRNDFPLVLRVLQVVLANVMPRPWTPLRCAAVVRCP